MIEIGKMNTLTVLKEVSFGVYLDGKQLGEILLPRRYVPEGCEPGQRVEVFIYLDSEDMLIATTQKPRACVGEFASMRVKSLTKVGAFLDWGLDKDLLLPFGEYKQSLEEGRSYLVYVYLDNSERLCATTKVDRYLDKTPATYVPGEAVDLVIADKTELGYKAIVNGEHWGVLYENELFRRVKRGYRTKGFIKKVRDDGKIDLTLEKPGYLRLDEVGQAIIRRLEINDGFLPLNDKSDPESIRDAFGISKKVFKNSIGSLYKQRLIRIEADGIYLSE
ncbi:CvfB family protein [Dongshaea marina]|uniref:CvfB family protein n=1 Tax=Dongshaea marina TaxID=2047966 RepID=UPI000D3EDDCE|nr:S1-like domain-containing RNA-binding protein [Dongshaea marina]